MEIERLKKIAFEQKDNSYFLKICLMALYSEWEGAIKSKVNKLIEECNRHNQSKFQIKKECFFTRKNLDNDEFQTLWKKIFSKKFIEENEMDLIDRTFFILRNRCAHGDLDEVGLEWS